VEERKKAIIFDMDGVLTDSEPVILEAAIIGLREYGIDPQPDDSIPFVGTGEDKFIGGVAEKYGVTYHVDMKKRVYEIYLEIVDEKIGVFPKIPEMLNELKKKLDELTANGDKEAFKANYEQLDPENAKELYAKVVKEQQANENVKKFAQVYAAMDASAAAQIFEQLGTAKIDMTAETLKAMSKENSSAILQSMTPVFAAKVTEKLNNLYRGN
jgi:flagellar motility protein MotE (MotC chaperone)